MANFIRRPGSKAQKHGGLLAYASKKDDRFTEVICSSCRKNPLTPAALEYSKRYYNQTLCYQCQRKMDEEKEKR